MGSGDVAAIFISGFFMLSIASVIILRGPLGKAWARRIEGTSAQVDTQMFPLVEDLQGRVAELEERVGRMHELEERLDFAERLLNRPRDVSALSAPRPRE